MRLRQQDLKWEIPIFGYVTATLATFFIGREAASEETDLAGVQSLKALQDEIQALRAEIRAAGSRDANI
jgi:voltage-gated potassium channel